MGIELPFPQANSLIAELRVVADDGDGRFEPGVDTVVATVTTLSPDSAGRLTVTLPDGNPLLEISGASSGRHLFVVVVGGTGEGRFQVALLTRDGSAVEDRSHDLPLRVFPADPVWSRSLEASHSVIFADDFESGDTSAWSGVLP